MGKRMNYSLSISSLFFNITMWYALCFASEAVRENIVLSENQTKFVTYDTFNFLLPQLNNPEEWERATINQSVETQQPYDK